MRALFLVAVMVAAPALAQTADLQHFLDAAEKGNVDRRISQAQREKAAADFRVAWTSLLPSLTLQGVWTHNQFPVSFPLGNGQVIDLVPRNQVDGVVRIDVPLIDTTRWFRTAAASTAVDAQQQRELATRDLVRRQVVGAYYGYAAALAVRESARKSTGVAEAQLKLMEIRANAGAVTELDLLRARAEVQRNRQVVADTESLVATTRRALTTLTNMAPPEVLPLPADDARQEGPLQELEGRVNELPAIKAGEKDLEAARTLATGSRLVLIPSLAGQFTERVSNATSFNGEQANYNLGLTLTWRIDGPTFANWAAQDSAASLARLAVERAQLQARDQVHSDWQRLNAALIKIEASAAQITAASRAAQVARDRYAAGAGTQVDVIQAERDLFASEIGQIQARTELASARASLRISAGLPPVGN